MASNGNGVARGPVAIPRTEVRTKGKPVAAERIKKSITGARHAVREAAPTPTCPAATLCAVRGEDGLTVRCGVERSLVTERESPSSLVRFCLGDYTLCPTWRSEKERLWAKRAPLVGEHEGV